MALVSISEAARLTGKNRKTVQRAIADGRLSMSHNVSGKPGIEISDLIRVFGEFSQVYLAPSHAAKSQYVAPPDAPNAAAMQAEIDGLKAVIVAKNETIDGLRQAMCLLEGQVTKRPWWRFGR